MDIEPTPIRPLKDDRIKAFLEACRKPYATMLRLCHLSFFDGDILICCPGELMAHALFLREEHLSRAARCVQATRISLVVGRQIYRTFPTDLNQCIPSTIMQQQEQIQIPTISEWELYQELCNFPGSASAVRFFDDLGVANNERVEYSSGVHPNDWTRLNNADFWIKEELRNYKQRLLEKGRLTNYPYVAFLATGEKRRFNVDARIALFRTQLIRIVKVNNCVPF